MAGEAHRHTGVSVMHKGNNWPRPGINGENTQTPKKQLNASIGPNRRLVGGGGMAVGPLRNKAGVAMHPKAARTALVNGMKG